MGKTKYGTSWLSSESANYFFDPDLALYNGRHYAPMDKTFFGIFADSCPDRWGRLLMKRRETIKARKEDRKPKKLGECDYLLGVYDEARMGFSATPDVNPDIVVTETLLLDICIAKATVE